MFLQRQKHKMPTSAFKRSLARFMHLGTDGLAGTPISGLWADCPVF